MYCSNCISRDDAAIGDSMSKGDEDLVPKWLSIDRDGFVSIDVRHPDFIRSFKDKFKDFGDVKAETIK